MFLLFAIQKILYQLGMMQLKFTVDFCYIKKDWYGSIFLILLLNRFLVQYLRFFS